VEDRYARPSRGVYDFGESTMFRGWLKGFKRGVKKFFLRSAAPDGPLERVTLQSVARDMARMEMEEPRGGADSPGAAYRESFCRDAFHGVIENNFLPVREDEGDVWPSFGDEPASLTPPPSFLRGGGNNDTDGDPRRPRIIGHEILTGPARVEAYCACNGRGECAGNGRGDGLRRFPPAPLSPVRDRRV